MQPQEQPVANLVVAETEDDVLSFCFWGDQCARDFLQWLDSLTLNDTLQVNVIAHNFQGYDGYFLVHQYYTDNQKVEQLRNGCKLLQVVHNDNIRFLDSLSFFQTPLSAFPKTFGSPNSKRATFRTSSTSPKTKIPVPAIDYYMPEVMSPDGRQAFEKWHKEQRGNQVVFDFQTELVAYCESDIRLLKKGV